MTWLGSITNILIALIAAGLLTFGRDLYRARKTKLLAATPEGREAAHVTTVDHSLVVVARARDELEADNERIRATLIEQRQQHADDRARWTLEKVQMRSEIDALEAKLRALLAELERIRDRHPE